MSRKKTAFSKMRKEMKQLVIPMIKMQDEQRNQQKIEILEKEVQASLARMISALQKSLKTKSRYKYINQ